MAEASVKLLLLTPELIRELHYMTEASIISQVGVILFSLFYIFGKIHVVVYFFFILFLVKQAIEIAFLCVLCRQQA